MPNCKKKPICNKQKNYQTSYKDGSKISRFVFTDTSRVGVFKTLSCCMTIQNTCPHVLSKLGIITICHRNIDKHKYRKDVQPYFVILWGKCPDYKCPTGLIFQKKCMI